MRIFFDTEFCEDGRAIDLISIGMVRDDGRTYYAQATDWTPSKMSTWVVENVMPNLKRCGAHMTIEAELSAHSAGSCRTGCPYRSAGEMRRQLVEFCGARPEFWADYASYDWVALCQIFGCMKDLPEGWPMFVRDVQQAADLPPARPDWPPHPGRKHHALDDAQDCRNRHAEIAAQGVAS